MSFSAIDQKQSQTVDLSTDAKKYLDEKSEAMLMVADVKGISGWMFDIPMGESISSKVSISKHYMENGSVVNDHAINEPDEITLSGLVGELVYRRPQGVEGALNDATSRLSAVNAYLGPMTQGATQKAALIASQAAYIANQAAAIAKRAKGVVDFFTGKDASLTLQQKAYLEITALQKTHQLVTVVTPWTVHYNMLIAQVTPSQDESSNDFSTFSVILQEARFTDIETTTFDAGNYKSAIDAQSAEAEDAGKVAGKELEGNPRAVKVGKALGGSVAQ